MIAAPSITTGSQWTSTFDRDEIRATRIILLAFQELPTHLARHIAYEAAQEFWTAHARKRVDSESERRRIEREIRRQIEMAKVGTEQQAGQKDRANLLKTHGARRILGNRRPTAMMGR